MQAELPGAPAMAEPTESPIRPESPPAPTRLLAASLVCENCGRSTPHRVLRWDRTSFARGNAASGVARCRECHLTHRFESVSPAEAEVDRIVSRGPVSSRERVRLPAAAMLEVDTDLPASDPPLLVHRIDLRSGAPVRRAPARAVRTVWVTPHLDPSVPVSILEGGRTRPARWTAPPEVAIGVGEEVEVDGASVRVIAIRARGQTWRHLGDRFRADEVQRLYGRRIASPPAGRSDWRRGREIPRSRTSSASRSDRSRSGPGVRRTRSVPRRRTASGGATVHKVSPW